KLAAAGVNYIDTYKRSGQYKVTLPFTLGEEGAGVVDALGASVTGFAVGDAVAWVSAPASYAEYVLLSAEKAIPVPPGVDLARAAAVLLQGMTAHFLALSTWSLQPGQTALVHAAAGGVGLLLTQIAKKRGAKVIGTVSTTEKAQLARHAGADEVILYTEQDFEVEVKRITGGAGVDVVYDSVGATSFMQSLNSLKPRGLLALYGQSSGAVPAFDPQLLAAKGSLFITRPTLGSYTSTREELLWRAGDLFSWMQAGSLAVLVDKTFPLADAPAAHRYLQSRASKGKLLLTP
ncbi:MAG: quinone oxidoreductase, partial [Armatimonadetes bacterium]|nr:quinone oxidoreductase [Anaerolineae bacterium]